MTMHTFWALIRSAWPRVRAGAAARRAPPLLRLEVLEDRMALSAGGAAGVVRAPAGPVAASHAPSTEGRVALRESPSPTARVEAHAPSPERAGPVGRSGDLGVRGTAGDGARVPGDGRQAAPPVAEAAAVAPLRGGLIPVLSPPAPPAEATPERPGLAISAPPPTQTPTILAGAAARTDAAGRRAKAGS